MKTYLAALTIKLELPLDRLRLQEYASHPRITIFSDQGTVNMDIE